jgi:hypothetical protein
MAKFTEKSSSCTSFFGVTFQATPQQLIDLFPNSYYCQNDGIDKTNFDFTLETENGDVFTIYDWKYYMPLAMNSMIEWHIGGFNQQSCVQGKKEVLELLNK